MTMKKIWFLSLFGLGMLMILISGCQKTEDQEANIDFKGQEAIQLDLFQPWTENDSWEENSSNGDTKALHLEAKLESPYSDNCWGMTFVMPKGMSWDQKVQELEKRLNSTGTSQNEYDIEILKDAENLETFSQGAMVISDFPITIKNAKTLSGKLGFINLKTRAENDDIVILGKNDPQKDSFIFLDKEAELDKIKFKNLNQEVKNNTVNYEAQYKKRGLWLHKNEAQLIKIIVWGNRFTHITMHYALGDKLFSLPRSTINHGSCEKELVDRDYINDENQLKQPLLVQAKNEYRITFSPIISGAIFKEATLTNDQAKLREPIPVKLASGEKPSVAFTLPSEGNYTLALRDEAGQRTELKFTTISKKELNSSNTYQAQYDKEKLTLTIVNDQFLTGAGLSGQLDQILGAGNYTFTIKDHYEYEEDRYGGNRNAWSERELKPVGKTLTISYFIVPNKHYTWNLEVLDIDGKKNSYPVDFFIEKIENARVSRDLFSQKLNVLPSEGYWANKIKVWSKNTRELIVYTQTCDLNTKGDFSKEKRNELLPPRKKKEREDQYDRRSTLGELHFFNCKGKIEEHKISVENFEYRKRIDRERELPASLKNSPYFRISFEKTMNDAKYYMRSPIGLFAKVAPYQELFLRGIRFVDGKAVNQGEIQIFDDHGKLLKTAQLGEQGLSFPLKEINSDYLFVRYQDQAKQAETFIVVTLDGKTSFWGEKRAISASWLMPEQTNQQENRYNSNQTLKVYGYTDRALYKPGDTVHFAGFVQDLAKVAKEGNGIQTGFVIVELRNHEYHTTQKLVISKLDEFGGFEGSFKLSENLGFYQLSFLYAPEQDKTSEEDFNNDREARENYKKTHPISQYWTDLQVQEFQKPSFIPKLKKAVKNNQLYLELAPSYYMWDELKDYDLHMEYTLSANGECTDCWWREKGDYYYNYVANDRFGRGGEYQKEHLTWWKVLFQIGDLEKLNYKGNKLQLKIFVTVKDNLSNETRSSVEYLDIEPEVKIGLNGYAYDWLDEASLKNYKLNAKIEKNLKKVKEISYERYFRPFDFKQETDTEGTYFYVNGTSMKLVQTWTLEAKSEFSIPLFFYEYQGGEYFLKVITKDENGTTNGEVDKNIYYYDSNFDKGFQGDMENNYSLHVEIPRKNYEIWKKIPITINPYIKGATALISVERGNQILEKQFVNLDGKELFITAKDEFYPNVQVSVTQFVGEQVNSQLWGSGEQKRHEPAFFAWYAEALIQENLKTITIQIETDKKEYQPWEKVKLKIHTTDHKGKAVTARVSLSVVDKALSDLYDLIKEPIPYFYNRLGSSIGNFGNRKNLYYALRTFFADGEKGGGGADGSLKNLRKKFYDLAFWDAAIITTGGKAELEFELPDNLTTWMIDAIAVSHKSQLGTERMTFKVNQPLLIEANLPTFLTIGDQISLPFKLIADTNKIKSWTEITLKGQTKNEKGEVFESFEKKGLVNSKLEIPIKVDEKFFDSKFLFIEWEVAIGNYRDAVQWKIPIRTEGLVHKIFSLEQNKNGEKTFSFEDEAVRGKLIARLAPFPTAVLAQPFEYLLWYYPKSSSENLIRAAQTALEAKKLTESWLLTGDLVQSGNIHLSNDQRMPIDELLENVIQQLAKRQSWQGGIKNQDDFHAYEYRLDMPQEKKRANEDYKLGISAFALLETMKENGYTKVIPQEFETKLNNYLNTLGNNTPELYLYYLAQKKTKQNINTAIISQLQKKHPNNIAVQTLSFLLLSQKNSEKTAEEQAKNLNTLFTQAFEQGKYFDGLIMDMKALQAYYLKWLLLAHKKFPKNQSFEQLIAEQILSLLKSRSQYGVRSRSHTTNFLVLEAINDALTSYYAQQGQATSCELTIGDQKLTLATEKTPVESSQTFENLASLPVKRSCKGSAFLDLELDYLLKDITKKKAELHNVENFSLKTPEKASIGTRTELKASFKTKKEAKDLTVEFSIPANLKLQSSLNPWDEFENGIFNFKNDWECFPDSYEFRFDRIVLRYALLRAGKQCDFTFYALPSFEGQFVLPSSKLYEANATEVWWSSRIVKE